MEIKTKYSIGDKLYYMESNCVQFSYITKVTYKSPKEIYYDADFRHSIKEADIDKEEYFTSKKKLLASL